MKKTLALFIVKHRIPILAAMLGLCVLSVFGIPRTRINYDLTRYLNDRTMTKRALLVMQEEFGAGEQLRVMFRDLPDGQLNAAVEALDALPEVLLAVHDPETGVAEQDGHLYQLVTLTLNDCDTAALIPRLRTMFPDAGETLVGGSAADQLDVQKSVGAEMAPVMAVSVAVVILVLTLTSHAWLEPLIILLALGLSILLNLGTNFVFPDVSFITFAVSAILQLALSIDYAIMLIHTYHEKRDGLSDPEAAMAAALENCFMRISSSAFTTVAGLLSLLFMSFTIGFDIGMVLSKGILISMLGVFTLMPSLTLLFEKPLRKTLHRPLRLGGEHLARGILAARIPVAVLLTAAVFAGLALHLNNRYTFTETGKSSARTGTQIINGIFGSESSPLVLLVPGGDEDADYQRQRALADRLLALEADGSPAVTAVASMTTTGEMALKYYGPAEVAEMTGLPVTVVQLFFLTRGYGSAVRGDRLIADAGILAPGNPEIASLQSLMDKARSAFKGTHYDRMLLTLPFSPSDNRTGGTIRGILSAADEAYGEGNYYVTGTHMSTYDIGNAFSGDLMRVNLITFLAIFLIVAIAFRSLRLPLLLVFVIEGAIWITMGLSVPLGRPIFFISYLICVSIQMGATIDYGILLSDRYTSLRRQGCPAEKALETAMVRSLPTVLTSGLILITAGFIIGQICSVFYIADIGALIARGASVSVLLVLTLLPALLVLLDRWIGKRKGTDRA